VTYVSKHKMACTEFFSDSMFGDGKSSRKVGAVFEKWWEISE
jgi:hypothetical protein